MTDDTDDDTAERATAYVCTDCGHRWYYARARCPECTGGSTDTYELDAGTLLAETTARVTPPQVRDENPLGLAEFDHGVTVVAQIAGDRGRPEVGDAVELAGEFALRGDATGPRLRPVEGAAESRGREASEGRP